jgi:hypothetical protein
MNDRETSSHERVAETLVSALVGTGAAWARYGLTIGRASLEASARTLEGTAALLGSLAASFEHLPPPPSSDDAPSP